MENSDFGKSLVRFSKEKFVIFYSQKISKYLLDCVMCYR